MKLISRYFPLKFINIHPLADLHIGAPESFFEKAILKIERSGENDFFVLAGDLVNNDTRTSVGDVHSQVLTIEEQFESVRRLLKKHKNKILGVISGNHEQRTEKATGINPLELICRDLGIEYDDNILILDISVGTHGKGSLKRYNYVLVMGHGYTSARTMGGKINANARLMNVINNADIYITAHTHSPSLSFEDYFEVDKRNKQLTAKTRGLVVIPAFLGYSKYAEQKFLQPTSYVDVVINLVGGGKEKKVRISYEWSC